MPGKNYRFVDEVRSRSFRVLVVNIHRDTAATVVAAALAAPAVIAIGILSAGAAVIVGAVAPRSLAQPIRFLTRRPDLGGSARAKGAGLILNRNIQ